MRSNMKNKKIIILVIGIVLIVCPFLINIYSIYKLLSVLVGIILVDVYLAVKKQPNIFLLLILPIIFLIFTYAIDYFKTYTFKLSPIFVIENKINNEVSIYNSVFYRIFKCDNEYIFDNNYEKNYACNTKLLDEKDVNSILSDPKETYKKYHGDFLKITGKISKITGTSNILLESYIEGETSLNGYVKFDKNSHLKIILSGEDISKYRIYDYITVVGRVKEYNKEENEIVIDDIKIEENNLYTEYSIHVIENDNKELQEYASGLYTYKIENIYLEYSLDRYELSYALKDKKILLEDFLEKGEKEELDDITIYKLEKFNAIKCSNEKVIFASSLEKIEKIQEKYCQNNEE